jgi:sucrose phosphorylase
VGRDINRPYFDRETIEAALESEVVQQLLGLIRYRNAHPAFQGHFHLGEGESHELRIGWRRDDAWIEAVIDFDSLEFEVRDSTGEGPESKKTDWSQFLGP